MLNSARAEGNRVGRIFMLWPMFVLFELYVAFSVSPSLPLATTPSSYTSFRFDGHTAAFIAFFFLLIFFYFLQFN